ncbi:MAG: type III pantothenate kinase [Candidatus Omnitrophica bacterium]|nr:type III pantothenate kinase [Candidatus Omnitrophota bacterium]
MKACQILAIDIGNTRASCACFVGRRLMSTAHVPTEGLRSVSVADVRRIWKQLGPKDAGPDAVVLASVVPRVSAGLRKAIKAWCGSGPLELGRNLTVPLKVNYRPSSSVGPDRLAAALAAVAKLGAPVIVLDFGTALTIDVVNAQGVYDGGLIVPGIELSLDSLYKYTALLPAVKVKAPAGVLGHSTEASLLSGAIRGLGYVCDGAVAEIRLSLGKKTPVLGTGGRASLMRRYTRCLDQVDPHLTLRGLEIAFRSRDRSL